MGIRFREWISQQGHTLQDHPRLTHALAVILADVRSAMPDTTQEQRLEAIKGLWNIRRDKLLNQEH